MAGAQKLVEPDLVMRAAKHLRLLAMGEGLGPTRASTQSEVKLVLCVKRAAKQTFPYTSIPEKTDHGNAEHGDRPPRRPAGHEGYYHLLDC